MSSGEAEYYGLVKGASQAIGLRSMLEDFQVPFKALITLMSDASAAIGIASRRGMGKVRHIEVAQLWLQEKIDKEVFRLVKVSGVANLADALTKPPTTGMLSMHMKGTSQRIVQGRHEMMPMITVNEVFYNDMLKNPDVIIDRVMIHNDPVEKLMMIEKQLCAPWRQ